MPHIKVVFHDSGGGHRATALALRAAFEALGETWRVSLTDLMDVLSGMDPLERMTGISGEALYNKLVLEWGVHAAFWPIIGFARANIRRQYDIGFERLMRCWESERPDVVISVIPLFNKALFQSLRQVWPAAPFFTLMTDLADLPPDFWLVPQDQRYIVGTARAAQQARQLGIASEALYEASGMVVHPSFYERHETDRAGARARLGLQPDLPTGLVCFGGRAPRYIRDIALRLGRCRKRMQIIFLCGRNEQAAAELRRLRLGYPFVAEGFTTEMPRYMELADFFIGKPGPGSVTEALVKGLPVVVSGRAMPQERYNLLWIKENGVGEVVPSWRRINEVIDAFIEPGTLAAAHARVSALRLRGVFDAVDTVRAALPQERRTAPLPLAGEE